MFALAEPVGPIDDFFKLPKADEFPELMSLAEADLYAFGFPSHTTDFTSSFGQCRKGTIYLSPLDNMDLETSTALDYKTSTLDSKMRLLFENHVKGNSFLSYAMPAKSEFIKDEALKSLYQDEFTLESKEILKHSPAYLVIGDSGGPLVKNDKIIAIASSALRNFEYPPYKISPNLPDQMDDYIKIDSVKVGTKGYLCELYFHVEKGFYLYVDCAKPDILIRDGKAIEQQRKVFEKIILETVIHYSIGKSSKNSIKFFNLLKNTKIECLENCNPLSVSYFTQTRDKLDWIQNVEKVAFNLIEQHSQKNIIENNAS